MRIPGPALVLPLFLAGCALPPAVTVASLVLDGVSYVSTGKSSTDHAISAIAREDCALLRVVDDKPICDPDGDVLVALSVGDAADENWSLDPETGSVDPNTTTHWGPAADLEANIEATPEPRRELSQARSTRKSLGATANVMPALTPGPVGLGSSVVSLATTITPAAPPSKQGFFAAARPAARPLEPQIAVKSIGPNKRLTLQEGQVTTFAVIGSFKNIENARRLVKSRLAGAIMQPVEIGGKTSYRVLVNQPLEQARKDGFADAWPVRLCSGDLQVPPCSQLVVIRDLRGVEVAARQLRR